MSSVVLSMKQLLFIFVLISLPGLAQLPVTLTTQEALLPEVHGIDRVNEPVSVGLPLPDSAGITSANQLGCSGSRVCQFRWLASWPDGHWKWVQFDYQASLRAGRMDTSTSLIGGTGNPGANLAIDSDPENPNAGTITVDTGVGGCRFIVQKATFDVLHSVVCRGKTIVAGGGVGLELMGPAFDSAPTATCVFNSTCATSYRSTNDKKSQCLIEENGPAQVAIKCTGSLRDMAGNKYMGFLVRMHFYLGKQRVKVIVTLKNADDGGSGSFAVSYKGYQSLELRLATTLTGKTTWAFGRGTSISNRGSFTAGGQSAYIYQGYASTYLDSGYCAGAPDAASDVARTSVGGSCAYAQNGSIVVDHKGEVVGSEGDTAASVGWANVTDASDGRGIEIGADYMAANFPRSLQITDSGKEVRIGISPDQSLWTASCNGEVPACRKIYYQAWPAYKVSDLDLIFHDSDLGSAGEANEFLKMQYHLIARAPIAHYNNSNVFTYPIVSAAEEDQFMQTVNPRFVPGSLKDMVPKSGCLQTSDSCFYMPRFYGWAAGGDSNQIESRYANLVHRWLARGLTGRYVFVSWFVRFQEQFAWPRAEAFRWRNHVPSSDLTDADGYPTACAQQHGQKNNLCATSGGGHAGILPNNHAYAYMDYAGTMENNWQHGHWWSLISYYYMTGDEDANDVLKDGVITEWTAAAAKNNISWTPDGPLYNLLYAARSIGEHLNGAVRYWEYLTDTRADPRDIALVLQTVQNNLSVVYGEACATDAAGNTYPHGCEPSRALSANGPYSRGVMADRGYAVGPGDFDNVNRCAPASGNKFAVSSSGQTYIRCVKLFMQGLFLDGLWAHSKIIGPSSLPDYNHVHDLAYGVASTADREMYVADLVPSGQGFPSSGQTVYEIAADQPNNMQWIHRSQESDTFISAPWMNLYVTLGEYTGDTKAWSSHFKNNFNNKGANASYNPNNITDYGSQQSAAVIDLLLRAPVLQLTNVPLHTAYDDSNGQWRLNWTAPEGVTHYFMKVDNARKIVDNLGWSPSSNNPIGDPLLECNWFAASYASIQPSVGTNSIAIPAPPTAGFMLKALVPSAGGNSH